MQIPRIDGRLLVDGKIIESGFARKPVFSPSNQAEIGTTPNVTTEILEQAVDAAQKAWSKGQGDWATARMEQRIDAVAKFRDQIIQRRELIAKLLMWEIGKTWPDSLAEFDRTITYINDTLEEVKTLDRDCSRFQFAGGLMAQIRRAPLGVTLCMGPFNYPLNETFTTLIPALIMGNVVVVKIPRFGQLIWDVMLEAFRDCFPAGVVNVVNGLGRQIIAPVVKTGKVDVLAFIGSSGVANRIKVAHPEPHRFRSILGLDAKNPGVILPDADLNNAVSECLKGTLSFNGQRCTALKILFVHKTVAKNFTEQLATQIHQLKSGLPWEEKVSITALPDFAKPGHLTELMSEAVAGGAQLMNPESGGKISGSLFFPALLTRVPLTSQLAQIEQFGPLVPVVEYESLEEFENYITHSPFGAQLSIFGRDPQVVGRLIDRLSNQVCRINLNTQCQRGPDVFPFTGRKASAEGTLSVFDALRSFSIRSMVAARQDVAGKAVIQGILDENASRFLTTNIVL